MASGTQLLHIFLCLTLCVHHIFSYGYKMAAQLQASTKQGKRGHAAHKPLLYAGDHLLQTFLTSHWPELGCMATLKPITDKEVCNCMAA